jgi:sigma-70-like protein
VDERDGLAGLFEAQRGQLRAVAYRMLGSWSEADDAVQEVPDLASGNHPEEEALLADSVSRALLVVLDTLDPAQGPGHPGDPAGRAHPAPAGRLGVPGRRAGW